MINRTERNWRRARSCTGGNCVEVAKVEGGYLVRDSKAPEVELAYSEAEWKAFVAGVKAGEFSFG